MANFYGFLYYFAIFSALVAVVMALMSYIINMFISFCIIYTIQDLYKKRKNYIWIYKLIKKYWVLMIKKQQPTPVSDEKKKRENVRNRNRAIKLLQLKEDIEPYTL